MYVALVRWRLMLTLEHAVLLQTAKDTRVIHLTAQHRERHIHQTARMETVMMMMILQRANVPN